MKRLAILVSIVVLFLTACNTTNTKIKEHISNADSVAINYFTGDGKMDSVAEVKIVRDKASIAKLTDFISASSLSKIKDCGYDGSLHFFKRDTVIQNVYFRMNDKNCEQFSFMQDGEMKATKLSDEAQRFLETIRKLDH